RGADEGSGEAARVRARRHAARRGRPAPRPPGARARTREHAVAGAEDDAARRPAAEGRLMVLGVLVAVAIVGAIVGAIAILGRGGRNAMDFAPRNLVRLYLYIASMAGIIVLVVGLSGVLTVGFAAAFGDGFVYGDQSGF